MEFVGKSGYCSAFFFQNPSMGLVADRKGMPLEKPVRTSLLRSRVRTKTPICKAELRKELRTEIAVRKVKVRSGVRRENLIKPLID